MWAVHLFFGRRSSGRVRNLQPAGSFAVLRPPLLRLSGGSQRAVRRSLPEWIAEFARKVRLHPPFLWEMIAGHTLSLSEFSKRHFQC
jgi:hypothetical protein